MVVAMGQVELLVTDLDGTLWELAHQIHPQVLAAWAEIERRGYPILVATGRRLASARTPLVAHGLTPPAVLLNGALAVDLATNRHVYQRGFSNEEAALVLKVFLNAGIEPIVYVADTKYDVFAGQNPSTHPEHLEQFGSGLARAPLDEVVKEYPVLHFAVVSLPTPIAQEVVAALNDFGAAHLMAERGYSGGSTITVAPRNHSKWDGVLAICEELGVDPNRVMAIGDGPNDLELLEAAAIAVTPADADPLALAMAHHVVPTAARGGWAQLLDLLP